MHRELSRETKASSILAELGRYTEVRDAWLAAVKGESDSEVCIKIRSTGSGFTALYAADIESCAPLTESDTGKRLVLGRIKELERLIDGLHADLAELGVRIA